MRKLTHIRMLEMISEKHINYLDGVPCSVSSLKIKVVPFPVSYQDSLNVPRLLTHTLGLLLSLHWAGKDRGGQDLCYSTHHIQVSNITQT